METGRADIALNLINKPYGIERDSTAFRVLGGINFTGYSNSTYGSRSTSLLAHTSCILHFLATTGLCNVLQITPADWRFVQYQQESYPTSMESRCALGWRLACYRPTFSGVTSTMSFWWLIPAISGLSFCLTAVLRRYALARSMIDVPNERSSHSVPTPRGGGVAIVMTFLISLAVMWWCSLIDSHFFFGGAGAGFLVAVIGFMDDHGHIAARWRLLGHFCAAAWALLWTGGLPPVEVAGIAVNLSWAGDLFALFYLVWLLNLYNFMDGIDGIASVEAVCVCLGACLLYWVSDHRNLVWGPLLLAMSVLGFLFWNFPPAKIFMGDAGSGFLGIILGVLSLQAASAEQRFLWAWVILLGVFIVDATFTLLRRLSRGDKVYEAHRSHAYQYASRQYGQHLPVTIAVGIINLFWLLPIALCVTRHGMDGAVGVAIAYIPLLLMALKYHAGELEVKTIPH